MNDDVGISVVGGNGVCHGGSVHDGKYLACGVHVDIAGTRRGDSVGNRDRCAWPDYIDNADSGGGGGISNVDCDASGPAVSDGVGTRGAVRNDFARSGSEHEDGVACEIGIDSAGAKGGDGIENNL